MRTRAIQCLLASSLFLPSIGFALDVETVPEIDAAFTITDCANVLQTPNIRCRFTALKPTSEVLRINAYSLRMSLWDKDKLIRVEFIPNGDLDSGDSYRHLIRSDKKITRISIDIPPRAVTP